MSSTREGHPEDTLILPNDFWGDWKVSSLIREVGYGYFHLNLVIAAVFAMAYLGCLKHFCPFRALKQSSTNLVLCPKI